MTGLEIATMIIAVINAFNEAPGIRKAIESVQPYVDEVRVYDGAYRLFPHTHSLSTDGMREIVKELGAKLIDAPDMTQIQKRTRSLQEAAGHTVLRLDGDEFVANPESLKILRTLESDIGWVTLHSTLYLAPYDQPRIVKIREGFHFEGKHHWIFDQDHELVTSDQRANSKYPYEITNVRIYNIRRRERNAAKDVLRRSRGHENKWRDEQDVYGKGTFETPKGARLSPSRVKQTLTDFNYKSGNPTFTATTMISRPWAVSKWFDHFCNCNLPWADLELLVIVDGSQALGRVVAAAINRMHQIPAYGVRLYVTGNAKKGERDYGRRERICANWWNLLPEIRGRFVLGFEDDTFPQHDAYEIIAQPVLNGEAAFVQGSIVGRWAIPFVPHWDFTYDDMGSVTGLITHPYNPKGPSRVEISGGGWYCFVCDVVAMREVGIRMPEPYHTMGPDVQFVKDLTDAGYICYGDWSVWCAHLTENSWILPSDRKGFCSMTLQLDANGKWARNTVYHGKLAVPQLVSSINKIGVRQRGVRHDPNKITETNMEIFTLDPRTNGRRRISISGTLWDCPFQMIDKTRALTLVRRGQVALIRQEPYFGVPFDGGRMVSNEGIQAPQAQEKKSEPQVDAPRNVNVWQPKVIGGEDGKKALPKQLPPDPKTLHKDGDLENEAFEDDNPDDDRTPLEKKLDAQDEILRKNSPEFTPNDENDPEVPDGGARCRVCDKILKKASGLTSHMRMHARKGEI